MPADNTFSGTADSSTDLSVLLDDYNRDYAGNLSTPNVASITIDSAERTIIRNNFQSVAEGSVV